MRPLAAEYIYAGSVNSGWSATSLPGVVRRSTAAHADPRGSFRELWRESWTADLSDSAFVQANLSRSTPGVLRGLHFHLRQADLWIVVDGRAHVALVDLRMLLAGGHGSPASMTVELVAGDSILIPSGVAHGFWALDELALVYLVTEEYDASDERGFAWDDPAAGVAWPAGRPVLSERDASNPSLAEAVSAARQRDRR
jgi:dTDP-4-dehydrorhamnose 3,5-epimerase